MIKTSKLMMFFRARKKYRAITTCIGTKNWRTKKKIHTYFYI